MLSARAGLRVEALTPGSTATRRCRRGPAARGAAAARGNSPWRAASGSGWRLWCCVGREGQEAVGIEVTTQSPAPSTRKIGLIFLISGEALHRASEAPWFQPPPLWVKCWLTAPLPTQEALQCSAHHPRPHISQNCSATAAQVMYNQLDKNKFTVKRKSPW